MRLAKLWLPVVIWAAVILSVSNDSFSADDTQGWLHSLFGRELPHAVNFAMRKSGHVIGYGILAALVHRAHGRLAVVFAIVLAVASLDEYGQARTASRSGTAWDVLLDLFGAALAVLIIRRARR